MKEKIRQDNLPEHIAVIMDGNGRWAKKQGAARVFGHKSAVKSVRDVTEGCAELGVKYLTLYAFSTENWNRPKFEVTALMELLVSTLSSEIKTLMDNDIRLESIGDRASLPPKCQRELQEAIDKTSGNSRMTLILALSYSGRWDIAQAMKKIALEVEEGKLKAENINQDIINNYLATAGIPDPELLIRTSGELRISNFLLWQMAYTEFFITETLWPDFRKKDLYEAIVSYQERERRFGKISEQIKK
ncbi:MULTISPECIES: isoprenyl transferase [Roseivirga]|jgi:undecaprenyl diphosphate synthase|uniref:isoprenyl transferase n=1 Tax=Roseivirga TaxID=290180 RepID=UPI00257D0076|nr:MULTISPECIES: isoprenyl transferase [Roseivirga]MEC7755957.1 isoprenyl transferase [Bacteroidota bacterium]|tara:strand:+ start:13440 stop:14177 length:738 start_codon:yes stop_codon:yes gene_type:complete